MKGRSRILKCQRRHRTACPACTTSGPILSAIPALIPPHPLIAFRQLLIMLLARHWLSARILATGQRLVVPKGLQSRQWRDPLPGAWLPDSHYRGVQPLGQKRICSQGFKSSKTGSPSPAARASSLAVPEIHRRGPRSPIGASKRSSKAQATDGPMMTWIFLRGTARGACAFRSITSNRSCFLRKRRSSNHCGFREHSHLRATAACRKWRS